MKKFWDLFSGKNDRRKAALAKYEGPERRKTPGTPYSRQELQEQIDKEFDALATSIRHVTEYEKKGSKKGC